MRPTRYGPFWVATTLIFTSTVSGNYANYLSYKRDEAAAAAASAGAAPSPSAASGGDQKVWYYDINKVRKCERCKCTIVSVSINRTDVQT